MVDVAPREGVRLHEGVGGAFHRALVIKGSQEAAGECGFAGTQVAMQMYDQPLLAGIGGLAQTPPEV